MRENEVVEIRGSPSVAEVVGVEVGAMLAETVFVELFAACCEVDVRVSVLADEEVTVGVGPLVDVDDAVVAVSPRVGTPEPVSYCQRLMLTVASHIHVPS